MMTNILKNECIYRDIWVDRCNDYYIPNIDTDFHLVIPVDEINESCSLAGLHSHNFLKGKTCQKTTIKTTT